ncbi:endonuclease V [Natronobacterium gregoryi]|uniref:Endonuclease V n=2 Tax=Natronobacterium gregoryi TaxID=44930 RepID=L0AH56_NATGS|nr:endonuclease V [Natronobacterium gregoryi]AFZ73228.1 deoxyinosine 3'endonuclease (endonuclease V) [Natronobacterium gregoryi SP2]ELY71314.1 endonuclease V [Natronobacterium gregoryi SP2]PLK21636.1 endonuclease V [Natronobacterium gregoryi SP2]SFI57955.1 Endonuclease V [Natronobacterium gregoryi]
MPTRPDLAPEAGLSRDEMEPLQREIADAAVFEDDVRFDPAAITTPLEAAASADDSAPIVAGVDQSFLDDDRALSAVVATQAGEVIERAHAVTPLEIPYIPGLLAFREGGPILAALAELSVDPDLLLFDGSGRIHFRQAGIATHVGVVRDVPSVGVAKSLLCGEPTESTENLPAGTRVSIEANSRVDAPDGTLLGYAVQTRQYDSPNRHINPLYVSPGHRVGPETAADVVQALSSQYKLPEPVRLADSYAEEAKSLVE